MWWKCFLLLFVFAGFITSEKSKKKKGDYFEQLEYVKIPAGMSMVNGRILSFHSFYMLDHEVTNGEYQQFVQQLKSNNQLSGLAIAAVDSMNWVKSCPNSGVDPYVSYYHSHPAYENYPVVNITYEAAEWYIAYLNELHKEELKKLNMEFALPALEEWIYAAKGNTELAKYSWGNNSLVDEKGQPCGSYFTIGDECVHYNDSLKKYEIICETSTGNPTYMMSNGIYIPEYSTTCSQLPREKHRYAANNYGLYNMSGNVAEMTAAKDTVIGGSCRDSGFDIRISSVRVATLPATDIGFRPVIRMKK